MKTHYQSVSGKNSGNNLLNIIFLQGHFLNSFSKNINRFIKLLRLIFLIFSFYNNKTNHK